MKTRLTSLVRFFAFSTLVPTFAHALVIPRQLDSSALPGFSGPIDGNRAMAFLYGPIDPSLDAAVWAAQGIAKHSPASAVLEDGDKALVSIRLAKAVVQSGIERFYFGVAMVPKREAGQEAFDCESCAPVLGATVFVKRGERWLVEAHNPFMATMGLNGQGGAMELVATGPARHGILASSPWQNRQIDACGVAAHAALAIALKIGIEEESEWANQYLSLYGASNLPGAVRFASKYFDLKCW